MAVHPGQDHTAPFMNPMEDRWFIQGKESGVKYGDSDDEAQGAPDLFCELVSAVNCRQSLAHRELIKSPPMYHGVSKDKRAAQGDLEIVIVVASRNWPSHEFLRRAAMEEFVIEVLKPVLQVCDILYCSLLEGQGPNAS